MIMTLTLTLPEELEQRLSEEARRHGVGEEELTVKLLGQHLPVTNRQHKLAALIRSWIDQGDQAEQQATGEF